MSSSPQGFVEVAERVWVARYPWFDVNITVIGSERGMVVVDTHGSVVAGREVVDDVRRLAERTGSGEVVTVVNTHWHWDHTFGNQAFREAWPDVPIHAHETAVEELRAWGGRSRQRFADSPDDPHREEVMATEIVLPDHTFSSARVLDLGDRQVELVHPGKAHSGGDLVVVVPDANLVAAGDLVEESGPPYFNDDCHPMDWPLSLDVVLQVLTPTTVVVPGHGAPVDREFVEVQRNEIGIVAETIRHLAGSGVPQEDALASAEWPFPADGLKDAVARGYAALPRSQKRLPLI